MTYREAPQQYLNISPAQNLRGKLSLLPPHVVDTVDRLSAIGRELVEEFNRRTRFHCDDHFVSNSNRKKGYRLRVVCELQDPQNTPRDLFPFAIQRHGCRESFEAGLVYPQLGQVR